MPPRVAASARPFMARLWTPIYHQLRGHSPHRTARLFHHHNRLSIGLKTSTDTEYQGAACGFGSDQDSLDLIQADGVAGAIIQLGRARRLVGREVLTPSAINFP